jgi:tetratricopeptide (TPR) repeat protein
LGHHFAEARASFADGVAQLENLPEEEFRRINDDGIYRARGALLLFLGDEQAADALERAAEIDPSDGNNFWMLGRLHLGQGKFDDALDDVQQALSLRKIDDPRYSRIAALAYLRGGEVAPALSHANTAIDLAAAEDIADRSAHHSLGALVHTAFARVTKALAHAELDQTHEATAELDLALRNWPPFGEDGVFVESEKQLLWFDTEEDLEVLVSEAWRRLGLEPKRRMPGEHDEE